VLQGGFNIMEGNPVTTTRCSAKFAFAEFRTVDETNACLNLHMIVFKGHPMNVARPRAYVGPALPQITWQAHMAPRIASNPQLQQGVVGMATGGLTNSAPLDANIAKYAKELFVGNLPENISDAMLQQFLNTAMQGAGLSQQPGEPVTSIRLNVRRCPCLCFCSCWQHAAAAADEFVA